MKQIFQIIFSLICSLTVISCTQKPVASEKEVAHDVANEPTRQFHGGVARKGYEIITNSKSLTEEQRQKFFKLHSRMVRETFAIQDEMSKLKVVLFDTVMTKPLDNQKIEVIKKRLIELNNKKMNNMLGALDEVKDILGQIPEKEYKELYRPFFLEHSNKM